MSDSNDLPIADVELAILETIYSSEKAEKPLTQRELAEQAGLSLGMTNVVLKRFAQRGWVLLRKLNSRTIRYALTPAGVNEVARRAYRYFQRTARTTAMYRVIIDEFVLRIKLQGKSRLVLLGNSDIDFILEYTCERHGLVFVKAVDQGRALSLRDGSTVVVVSDRAKITRIEDEQDLVLMATILTRAMS